LKALEKAVMTLPELQKLILSLKRWLFTPATISDRLGRAADVHADAPIAAIQKLGDPLLAETLESIRRTKLALKGPLTTPIGGGFRSAGVRLREEFRLYANVRPVRTLIPGQRYENIDLVPVRENLEGLYVGDLEMLWSSANTAKNPEFLTTVRNEYLFVTARRV
jgi:isocitrate dehydrogenase